MAIEFECPHCRETLRLKDKFAGQRGSCRHCGGEIVAPIPEPPGEMDLAPLDDAPPLAPAPRPAARPVVSGPAAQPAPRLPSAQPQPAAAGAGGGNAGGELIRFHCEHCGAGMKAPPTAAGRAVECPRCHQRLRVPGAAPAPRPPAQPAKPPAQAARPAAQPISRSAAAQAAPVARRTPQPAPLQPTGLATDDLELLPDTDNLELLPETNSLMDALDDTIPLSKSEEPLRPLPRPVAPVAPKRPRRKSSSSGSGSGGLLKAAGGGLTTLLILGAIGLRFFGALAPIVDPNKVDSNYVAQLQRMIQTSERCVQMARSIHDVPSAQQTAPQWANLVIDVGEQSEAINKQIGKRIYGNDAKEVDRLQKRDQQLGMELRAETERMMALPGVGEIVSTAMKQAAAQHPNSAIARELRGP